MEEKSRSFKDVRVWQEAHAWVLEVYRLTEKFPVSERYGLTSQLRRAATSVPSNIVEGFRRRTKADKIRFYNIAHASLDEAAYQLLLAHDLGFASTEPLQAKADEVAKRLSAYIQGLERSA